MLVVADRGLSVGDESLMLMRSRAECESGHSNRTWSQGHGLLA